VAFGLLHHVPSFARRRELLSALAERLGPGGRLAVSVWRFGAFERFHHKQVPFEPPIQAADLEPGDVLLSFGKEPGAVRYCHFLDEEEIDRLSWTRRRSIACSPRSPSPAWIAFAPTVARKR
jgi:hypothetical protein